MRKANHVAVTTGSSIVDYNGNCSTPPQLHIPSACTCRQFFVLFAPQLHSPTCQWTRSVSQISSPTFQGAHLQAMAPPSVADATSSCSNFQLHCCSVNEAQMPTIVYHVHIRGLPW
uniref:Uncharacterized protein n=1 Tax=Opuntia streptacantha TaxID=393608 RepID=A0A7C8ZUV9_OPUST